MLSVPEAMRVCRGMLLMYKMYDRVSALMVGDLSFLMQFSITVDAV